MIDETEHEKEENKQIEHVENKIHEKHERKSDIRINLTRLGKNKKEVLENLSFIIIVISAILFAIGIGLGSFIQGTIFLSVFGSFFVIIGIIIYIASQFIEV